MHKILWKPTGLLCRSEEDHVDKGFSISWPTFRVLQVHHHWLLLQLFIVQLQIINMSSMLVISFSNFPSKLFLIFFYFLWICTKKPAERLGCRTSITYYSRVTSNPVEHLAAHTKNWNTVIWKIFHLNVFLTKDAMYSLSHCPKQKHSIYPLMVSPGSCSPTSSHCAQTVLNRPSLWVKRGVQASCRINSCLNLKPCKKWEIRGEMLENSPWRLALLPMCQKWVSYGESETQAKGQVQ